MSLPLLLTAGRTTVRIEEAATGLPALDEHWGPALGEPLRLGIGVNTGMARVGNMGTQRKFNYGPQGNSANLASRCRARPST
ncbi:MAG TPA: adenylate/guanylate cyclase domain-containing protein [Gemmataceae bacterium]|nr:adenylate/guanylate cyclase domain-containing protein [Gemmataceae bacterium]